MRNTFLAIAAAAAACVAWSLPAARADEICPRVPPLHGRRNCLSVGQGRRDLGESRARADKGRINIKMYPGVSLVAGDQTREFTAIRQGVIDLAIGSTINWSPQVKELNLFSLPFLMPDYARSTR